MTVVVRPPVVGDVDRLAEINVGAWRSAYGGIVPSSYLDAMNLGQYRERWTRNLIAPIPGRGFFAADVDGVLAAYAIGGPYRPQQDAAPEDTAGWGEVYAVYTDPAMQGVGAGTAVLDAAIGFLRGEGRVEAALWVLRHNAAARCWYAARGWRADGATSWWTCADESLPEIRLRRSLR